MKLPRHLCALLPGLLVLATTVLAGPFSISPEASVKSVSGQFLITAATEFSPLLHNPAVAANPDFIRLEPTFLTVSAERIKSSLARLLQQRPGENWSGKIHVALHPARSLAEEPLIVAEPFLQRWNCRVEMPDVTIRPRLVRALTAALLLENANRRLATPEKPAEIPSWLADGLAQEILAEEGERVILAAPVKTPAGVSETRHERTERVRDSLAEACRTLQSADALTVDQLSWPAPAQLSGADNGAYRASAQLFVHSLLGLKNGPANLRRMLAQLAQCENWQTAFFNSFAENFSRPLDVEKWWSLRLVNYVQRDPGPRWTPAASRDRLTELLAVPVDIRTSSNALPQHMEISLQTAVRSFDAAQQATVLPLKLRDLELAKFRFAPEFAALAEGYRSALGDFLGQNKILPADKLARAAAKYRKAGKKETIQRLDALDTRRRELEIKLRVETIRQNLIHARP
jgi:hypothetical protein